MTRPLIIWRFFDGRPGHRNQVLGLTEAILRRTTAECLDVVLTPQERGFRSLLPGRQRSLKQLPCPDLIVGAGHSTHLPLICARARFGGRTVVLMKPSLPRSLFDLCLVPAADGVTPSARTIVTQGALNRVLPSTSLQPDLGLILIGGPSEHYGWNSHDLMHQLTAVIRSEPRLQWTLTTSRRTPPDFLDLWQRGQLSGTLHLAEHTTPDWLPAQLQKAGTVWATADSVSMVYEALSAGGRVGLLSVPQKKSSRVTRGIDALCHGGFVTPFSDWRNSGFPDRKTEPLNEASRCAEELLKRLFPDRSFGLSHRSAA